MTVEVTIGGADTFSETMRRYADAYTLAHPEKPQSLGQMVVGRALNLALKLYQATKDIAPTQSQIAADVQRQGWKIPEQFPDGRLGRGTPDQWASAAVAALPKQRGRKSKARTAQEAAILGNKPTLQQMQAFVIKHRSGHAGFIASGWLGAVHDLGGKSGGGRFGRAEIRNGGEEIDIINDAPGCTEAEQKYHYLNKGILAATSDMDQKIDEWIEAHQKAA